MVNDDEGVSAMTDNSEAPEGSAGRRETLAGMIRAFKVFADLGYDYGANGHMTVRDPDEPGRYWINPLTVPFEGLTESDLVLVDESGQVVAGRHPIRVGGFLIQKALHEAREDANAVVHLHGVYTTAWASAGQLFEPVNQDARIFHGVQALYDEYPCGSIPLPEEGRRAAAALGPDNRLLFLRNHGVVTVGTTIAEAAWGFIAAERVAQVHLLLGLAGAPKLIATDLLDAWAERMTPEVRREDALVDYGRYERSVDHP